MKDLSRNVDKNIEENVSKNITVRPEHADDVGAIKHLTEVAFKHARHSSHNEHFIVSALRDAGQLSISLVAVESEKVVGHVAVSPVTVSSGASGWYGLGPISVAPDHQGQGIGSMLMKTALSELRGLGGAGCVLLGNPAYYQRFGFICQPGLEFPAAPKEHFQAVSFSKEVPVGIVDFHPAFEAIK